MVKFKRIGLLLFFLIFLASFGFAENMESQIALEEYLENGYNEVDLVQRNTVLKFQAENNLMVDGIIGDLTIEALSNENKIIVDIKMLNFIKSEISNKMRT
mgnify:CR=1 FL=1